jgi:hypothetical protein
MKRLASLLSGAALTVLLGACATAPSVPPASPLPFFRDASFSAPVESVGGDQVFALNDEMRRYVNVEIAPQLRRDGLQRGLINALYRRDQLRLDYDSEMTRNAAQAFDARRGNCLSLVIMTAALAKELGLRVTYQSVDVAETWSRSDDIAFFSGHVNLTLGPRPMSGFHGLDENSLLTVDFLPPEDVLGQRTKPISEETIVAMYMNNRSAEALAQGRIDDAYWWARAAILRAPALSLPYNTLGVIYLRHGDPAAAEGVLKYALDRQPANPQLMSNLAGLYDKLGRTAEAGVLRAQLARIEPDPPFAFFRRGMAAYNSGDYKAAKGYFTKEVARADYNGEFHFWLGVAHLRLGDEQSARKEFAIAIKSSTTRNDHALYAAKLDHLLSSRPQ